MEIARTTLLRWAEALAGSAMTGMGFTENLYEEERFEEVLKIAAEIRSSASIRGIGIEADSTSNDIVDQWIKSIGKGVQGYVTPKSAVATIVGNERGQILLVQRSDSGIWLYPTGWADVGYSPAEVAVKEVREETGIDVIPVRILSVIDGLRRGFTAIPLYSLIFYCKAVGGELKAHPLECRDVGWFDRDHMPSPMNRPEQWMEMAFDAIDGKVGPTLFDSVRDPLWNDTSSSGI